MKVYTKGGDRGETSLASGRRVRKDHAPIEAYGTVDELNAFCGLLAAEISSKEIYGELSRIQNGLFNVGAQLARDNAKMDSYPEISQEDIDFLETAIDAYDSRIAPLRHFILPGGSKSIALCHVCRTVTRRAERRVISLEVETPEIERIIIFLNRLSDYFFILARYCAHIDGVEEIKWQPKTV
jgi:cob(I)alamin adenosyltransferase